MDRYSSFQSPRINSWPSKHKTEKYKSIRKCKKEGMAKEEENGG